MHALNVPFSPSLHLLACVVIQVMEEKRGGGGGGGGRLHLKRISASKRFEVFLSV